MRRILFTALPAFLAGAVATAERPIRSIDMSAQEKQQMLDALANSRHHSIFGGWNVQR